MRRDLFSAARNQRRAISSPRRAISSSAESQFWKPGSERPRARLLDDEEGGALFFNSTSSFSSAGLEKQRQRLPVYRYRDAILYLVENHSTTIVVGETGSGKTTQIPQETSTK